MDIPRIVQRAFSGNGIKSTGICITDILDLAGQGGYRFIYGKSDNPGQDIPGGPAGCPSFNFNRENPAIFDFHTVFRQTELAAIIACSLQASESASGKRSHGLCMFFAGGNNGNILPLAYPGEVGGKVRVL